jgi:hypothetical protein
MYKKDMYKTEIKDILNKNEMSMDDIGQFLKHISDFLEDTDFSLVKPASLAVGDAERIIDAVKAMVARLIALQDEIESAENVLLERLDKTYENVTKKQHEIQKKLEDIEPLSIRVSCNMKDRFEFQHLDKEGNAVYTLDCLHRSGCLCSICASTKTV